MPMFRIIVPDSFACVAIPRTPYNDAFVFLEQRQTYCGTTWYTHLTHRHPTCAIVIVLKYFDAMVAWFVARGFKNYNPTWTPSFLKVSQRSIVMYVQIGSLETLAQPSSPLNSMMSITSAHHAICCCTCIQGWKNNADIFLSSGYLSLCHIMICKHFIIVWVPYF